MTCSSTSQDHHLSKSMKSTKVKQILTRGWWGGEEGWDALFFWRWGGWASKIWFQFVNFISLSFIQTETVTLDLLYLSCGSGHVRPDPSHYWWLGPGLHVLKAQDRPEHYYFPLIFKAVNFFLSTHGPTYYDVIKFIGNVKADKYHVQKFEKCKKEWLRGQGEFFDMNIDVKTVYWYNT